MKTAQALLLLASLVITLCIVPARVRASIPDCNSTRDIDAARKDNGVGPSQLTDSSSISTPSEDVFCLRTTFLPLKATI